MKIVNFSETITHQWNECCEHSSQAWLFHRAEWVDIESDYFGVQNFSFAIVDGGDIIAVHPLYLSEVGLGAWVERLVHSGIHRHTGLAYLDTLSSPKIQAVKKLAIQHIERLAQKLEADRIQLNVQNLAPESFTPSRQEIPYWVLQHDFYLGLRLGALGFDPTPGMSSCAADQIISLLPSEEILFLNLEDACRRAIRKATSSLLVPEISVCNFREAIEAYYQLAVSSAKRTGESLSSRDYFDSLGAVLGPSDRLAIVFAIHKGRRIAGVLLGIDKKSATYLGGVSDPDYLDLRPNDFVHWAVIKWAKEIGLLHYRLGPIFPEVPKSWMISRVSRFKAKFGGKSFSVIQGSKFLKLEKYELNPSLSCARSDF